MSREASKRRQCGGQRLFREAWGVRRGFFVFFQWLPFGRLQGTGGVAFGVPEMVACALPLPPGAATSSASSPRCVSGLCLYSV